MGSRSCRKPWSTTFAAAAIARRSPSRIRHAARRQLSQHVVGVAQRARRLQRARLHGQALYIDPKAEMVIARFASHHLAANANYDATSLPAYQAVAELLLATR